MQTSVTNHWRAIFFALLGFTFWTSGDTLMKLAAEIGAPKYEIMIIAGLSGMIAIFAINFWRGTLTRLDPDSLSKLAVFAFTFGVNYLFFLIGLPHLPLASFYTIIFATPMAVAVMAVFFLHEKLNLKKGIAIGAGFIGVLIALDPFRFHFTKAEVIGYSAAFASMLIITVQMLLLRAWGQRETGECLAFYPRLGAIIGGLIVMYFYGLTPLSFKAIVYSVGTGCIGAFGWLSMAQAYRLARASTVAPFHYSQIITGTILGYVIWHDVPSLHLIIGAMIIIISGIYIATHPQKAEQIQEDQLKAEAEPEISKKEIT